jgi:hypothetical protein
VASFSTRRPATLRQCLSDTGGGGGGVAPARGRLHQPRVGPTHAAAIITFLQRIGGDRSVVQPPVVSLIPMSAPNPSRKDKAAALGDSTAVGSSRGGEARAAAANTGGTEARAPGSSGGGAGRGEDVSGVHGPALLASGGRRGRQEMGNEGAAVTASTAPFLLHSSYRVYFVSAQDYDKRWQTRVLFRVTVLLQRRGEATVSVSRLLTVSDNLNRKSLFKYCLIHQ